MNLAFHTVNPVRQHPAAPIHGIADALWIPQKKPLPPIQRNLEKVRPYRMPAGELRVPYAAIRGIPAGTRFRSTLIDERRGGKNCRLTEGRTMTVISASGNFAADCPHGQVWRRPYRQASLERAKGFH